MNLFIKNIILLTTLLISPLSNAWQLKLHDQQIFIQNTEHHQQVDTYLIWFDWNAPEKMQSWHSPTRWQSHIQPMLSKPIDIEPFPALFIDTLPSECQTDQSCFLVLLAVPTGQDVLQSDHWQTISILPLTETAAKARFIGQTAFNSNSYLSKPQMGCPVCSGGGALTNDATRPVAAGTEKPDIFKYHNNELIYANYLSQRLQIIDLHDPDKPFLKVDYALKTPPHEIYTMGDFYVLLQSDWRTTAKTTTVNVFQYNANEAKLEIVSHLDMPGYFRQSRRRGDVIYTLSADYPNTPVQLHALSIDSNGQAHFVSQYQSSDRSDLMAVFEDYLVLVTPDYNKVVLDVFDLRNPAQPLRVMGEIHINGTIPSDLHIDIRGQFLRIVYQDNDPLKGSHLAIYDLNTMGFPLLGEIAGIAPNESLKATRFTDTHAYVVTFRQIDPLWKINLESPHAPYITGELEVPGWSDKLFFQEKTLFAVGIENSKVSASLFDVSQAKPLLLDRIIPGDNRYSYSPSQNDERAFFLNWDKKIAAIPLQDYLGNASLSILTFKDNNFAEWANLSFPDPVKRSFFIDEQHIGVLTETGFFSVGESAMTNAKIQVEIPLSLVLSYIKKVDNQIWAGHGTHLYPINQVPSFNYLELYEQAITLPFTSSNQNTHIDGDSLVSVQRPNGDNFRFEVFNLTQNQSWANYQPKKTNLSNYGEIHSWLENNMVYLSTQSYYFTRDTTLPAADTSDILPLADQYLSQIGIHNLAGQWILRRWQLTEQQVIEKTTVSTPGKVLGQNSTGNFIAAEENSDKPSKIRLNRLRIVGDNIRLLQSRTLENCYNYDHAIELNNDAIYVYCRRNIEYIPNTPDVYQLLKISSDNLTDIKQWDLPDGYQTPIVNNEMVLLSPIGFSAYKNPCKLAYLKEDGLEIVYEFKEVAYQDCPDRNQLLFDERNAYRVNGYDAVEAINY